MRNFASALLCSLSFFDASTLSAAPLRETVSLAEAHSLFLHLAEAPLAGGRPLPWKYPSDGCYARAALSTHELERLGFYSDKIFVEGDLRFPTRYAVDGKCARWRYHISPVVYVRGPKSVSAYALDPTLFTEPVPYRRWISAVVPDGERCGLIYASQRPEAATPRQESDGARPCFSYITSRFHTSPADATEPRHSWMTNELEAARATARELAEVEDYSLRRLKALPPETPYCKGR